MSQTSSMSILSFLSAYGNISITNQSFLGPNGDAPVMGLSNIRQAQKAVIEVISLRFMLVLFMYVTFFPLHLDRVVCTDTVVSQEPDMSTINNLLYCGYRQARCNGSSVSEEYSAAWDFSTSSLTSLSMNSWCEGCRGLHDTSSNVLFTVPISSKQTLIFLYTGIYI